jgi:hypothetical protein
VRIGTTIESLGQQRGPVWFDARDIRPNIREQTTANGSGQTGADLHHTKPVEHCHRSLSMEANDAQRTFNLQIMRRMR